MADNGIDKVHATEEIIDNIKKTYRSMFNTYNRLIVISKLQKFSTIAMAIYILAISIIILNNDFFTINKIYIFNIYLIILSIISLTLSLTIGGSENRELAGKYLECARQLQHLYNSTLLKFEQNKEYKLIDEENQYYEILMKYELRQQQIDYEYYKYEKYKKNKINSFFVFLFHIKYFIFTKIIYLLLFVLPLLGILLIQII